MKRKLIGSICSMVVAFLLCICSAYAWFTINDKADVQGIAMTVTSEEDGSVAFDETSMEITSTLLPNKTELYKLKTTQAVDKLSISISETNPTSSAFNTFFSDKDNTDMLLGDYYKNYYNEDDDLISSYLYSVSEMTNDERISFLYSFLENNMIASFMKLSVSLDGEAKTDLNFDEENSEFYLDIDIPEDTGFYVYVTFGNGKCPIVNKGSTASGNLSYSYTCKNFNCFMLSSIVMSFDNTHTK